MIEAALIVLLLALLLTAWGQRGKWRERARASAKTGKANRKANEIQNRIAADPAYRERVRRHFDSP